MVKVFLLSLCAASVASITETRSFDVRALRDAGVYFNGRWDSSPGTWWAGSGIKFVAHNLESLVLNLGPNTTIPHTAAALSINYEEFITVNVSQGSNVLSVPQHEPHKAAVIRLNVEGWQNNRMNLKDIIVNKDARILRYVPSELSFLFIGDSLSAGQYLPQGINQAWPFLVGEHFKAEHVVTAQPGATLKDIVSYGNMHGMEFQFFRTEDTGYYYTTDHNYTTPWDFKHDTTDPTHIVIHIGANDASQGVTDIEFVQIYVKFVKRLRKYYPRQQIFVFTPWGWPSSDAPTYYYYPGLYAEIVQNLNDPAVHLVDTTGWVTWDDVFPDNQHPNVPGHINIATTFTSWLNDWGLQARGHWETVA